MAVLYTNNAASNLSASITNTATSFSVTSGQGALFPAITGSDYFYVTLLDNSGNIEIVKVTARNTDTFTVTRAQDGTTARAWSANDKVELRITRSMLDDLKGERMPVYGPSVGSGGRVMINMSGNPAWSDANFTYDVIMGQFRATSFRANVGDSAPTWNFNNILHAGNYSSYALPLTGGALTGLTSITGGSFDTTYTSTQTRFADGGVQAMKTVDAGVFEAIRAVNLATTAGTTVRLVAAATSDAFNNTNGGKVFIDAVRTATNMDLVFSLNATAGAAPTERVRFFGGGGIQLDGTNTVLHSGNYSSYAAPASHTHSYLPLSGGTMTGSLVFSGATGYSPISITGGVAGYYPAVQDGAGRVNWYWNKSGTGGSPTYEVSGEDAVRLKFSTSQAAGAEAGIGVYYAAAGTAGAAITWTEVLGAFHNRFQYLGNTVLHAGNYTSYAAPASHTHSYLPLSGGTMTGAITGGMAAGSQVLEFANADNYASMRVVRNFAASANRDGMYIGYGNSNSGRTRIYGEGSTGGHIYPDVNGNLYRSDGVAYLHSSNYTSYAPSLTGSGASGTWGISITGNAATATAASTATSATSAGSVSGLTLTSSANGINPDSVTQNQLGYNNSVSLFGQTDGGLYSSAYSSSWIHQIYGDFRTGQIAIRGKNSGTWQAWRVVLDSSNYTSYGDGRYVQKTGDTMTGALSFNVGGTSIFIGSQNVTTTNALRINWHTDSDLSYYIGKRAGTWTQPMDIAFYTGLRYHAHYSYGGHRFYTQGLDSNLAFSVGDGDNDVRLYSNLRITTATSPNTNYFLFGDNSGWIFRFMTNVSGTATERFRFSDQGAFNAVGAITQNGNQVLHAGNYTSYIGGGSYSGTTTITSATAGDTWNSTLTSTTLADKLTSRFTKTNTPPAGIQTNYIGGLAFNGKNYLGNSYEFATIVGSVLSASSLASGAYALGQIELNAYFFSSSLALSAGLKIGNSAFIFSGSGGQYLSIQSGGIVPTTSGTVSLGNSTQGFGQAYFQSVRLNNGWYENSKLLQFSGSLAANYNAMLAGPVTLDTGYTITIETGATLTIV